MPTFDFPPNVNGTPWDETTNPFVDEPGATDGPYRIMADAQNGIVERLAEVDPVAGELRSTLALSQTCDFTPVSFSATTGDFSGTAPDAVTLTIPATLTTPELPWTDIGLRMAMVVSAPCEPAPSEDHRLVGVRVRLEVSTPGELTDIVAMIFFSSDYFPVSDPIRIGSAGDWVANPDFVSAALLTSPDALIADQDVALMLRIPLSASDASTAKILVGWVAGDAADIGAGSTISMYIAPEWLWAAPASAGGGGTPVDPQDGALVFADELYGGL